MEENILVEANVEQYKVPKRTFRAENDPTTTVAATFVSASSLRLWPISPYSFRRYFIFCRILNKT